MNRPVEAFGDSWQQFAASEDAAWPAAWLRRVVDAVGPVGEAVLILADEANAGPFRPAAFWPAGQACGGALAAVCERALATRLPFGSQSGGWHFVARPLLVDADLHGVVAFAVEQPETAGRLRATLDWSIGWLLLRRLRERPEDQAGLHERLLVALDITLLALGEAKAETAIHSALTELAVRLGADRVAVGFGEGPLVHFYALSHSTDFSRRIELTRMLEAAMNEASEQGERVLFRAEAGGAPPERPAGLICREHERLARAFGSAVILSVPFAADREQYGSFVFEWPAEPPSGTLFMSETLVPILGRVLLAKRHADRSLGRRFKDFLRHEWQLLLGPAHGRRKALAGGLALSLLFLAFAHGEYRVAAKAALEGEVRRQIVAPFDGFVAAASARAGQQVKAGQVLALLDDRDLRLEAQRWASQQEQYSRQARDAEAQANLAQIQIAMAQTQQAAAQRALSESQLARSRVTAPFAGVVTSGDLSQHLGGAVRKGDTLFEIAPLDAYRVVLEVEEGEIAPIAAGQRGKLVVTALTGEQYPFVVTLVTPVAKAREGKNFFRVEARLESPSRRLRPGMEGIAKVSIGERRLVWIWTHRFFDWLRLQAWSWLGI